MIEVGEVMAAYMAGMIDADGTIGIRRHRLKNGDHYLPVVEVANMCREAVDIFSVHFGNTNRYEKRPKHVLKSGGIHIWKVTGKNIIPVLRTVRPHLIIKKSQSDVALVLAHRMRPRGGNNAWSKTERDTESAIRHDLYLQAKRLNLPYHLRESGDAQAKAGDSAIFPAN